MSFINFKGFPKTFLVGAFRHSPHFSQDNKKDRIQSNVLGVSPWEAVVRSGSGTLDRVPFWPLDPGSQTPILDSLVTIFWVNTPPPPLFLLFLDQGSGIQDLGSRIWDPGRVKIRIRDKHPGSATLVRGQIRFINPWLLILEKCLSTTKQWTRSFHHPYGRSMCTSCS